MNAADKKWISRKEIAILTGFTVARIRRNEKFFGLDKIKEQVNARTVLYYRTQAMVVLQRFIVS